MPRHLLLVTCMYGIKRLSLSHLLSSETAAIGTELEQSRGKADPVYFDSGPSRVPLKPTAQSFGLTAVPLDARSVPRNFDDI